MFDQLVQVWFALCILPGKWHFFAKLMFAQLVLICFWTCFALFSLLFPFLPGKLQLVWNTWGAHLPKPVFAAFFALPFAVFCISPAKSQCFCRTHVRPAGSNMFLDLFCILLLFFITLLLKTLAKLIFEHLGSSAIWLAHFLISILPSPDPLLPLPGQRPWGRRQPLNSGDAEYKDYQLSLLFAC